MGRLPRAICLLRQPKPEPELERTVSSHRYLPGLTELRWSTDDAMFNVMLYDGEAHALLADLTKALTA